MEWQIDGVAVTSTEALEEDEVRAYVDLYQEKCPGLYALNLKVDGDFVDVEYRYDQDVPFERIRRITGYLVGTLDRFNDAKRAEESDRVKHNV
ncbi:MAG: anaerobic ribonucleoside-triphosphate reductase [Coriobacteriia bacterium]|nr:anaerobic ribonucleoside-triphosphate reductase [Coriobacteriia bacterium]